MSTKRSSATVTPSRTVSRNAASWGRAYSGTSERIALIMSSAASGSPCCSRSTTASGSGSHGQTVAPRVAASTAGSSCPCSSCIGRLWHAWPPSSDGEQLLEEGSESPSTMHEVHLEDPVQPAPRRVEPLHRQVAARRDVQSHLVAHDSFVRELAEDQPAVRAAALPTLVARDVVHHGKELSARDVRCALEVRPATCERRRNVISEPALDRVASDHVGTTQVRLPVAEHRAEVGEDDVVIADHTVRRILAVGQQRVRARPDD